MIKQSVNGSISTFSAIKPLEDIRYIEISIKTVFAVGLCALNAFEALLSSSFHDWPNLLATAL